MFEIDDIVVDEEIINTYFSCDLLKCKGACCTFQGRFGAPVYEEEIPIIENHLDIIFEYLPERSKKIIEAEGFVEKSDGSFTTVCINHRDCVFVYYDDGIALCAIERAYFEGKIDFRKPVTCQLFPVRAGNFGGKYIYYEKIKECNPGIKKGQKERVRLISSLKEGLTRSFGVKWYDNLLKLINGTKI